MINQQELQSLSIKADNGYLQLVILSLILALLLVWAWRSPQLRALTARLSIPLPFQLNIPLWAIVALGFVLRLPRLSDSLWYDETFTARITSLPIPQMFQAIMGDVHPPLWYLIEWVTVRLFGSSEIALRLPSLLFGTFLIWLTWRLCMALKLRDVAKLAALLVALSPAMIHYANEARYPALLACLALGMVICIAENKPRLYPLLAVAICLTHNLGYVYLGILGVLSLYLAQDKKAWFIANGVAGIGASLWLPALLYQSGNIADGFWIQPQTLGGALWVITDMTIGKKLLEPLIIVTFIPTLMLTFWSFATVKLLQSRTWMPLIVLALGIPLAVALVSALWRPVYISRAFLPGGVALLILWAILLARSHAHPFLLPALAGVLLLALFSFYQPDMGRIDNRAITAPCRDADLDFVYATSIPAAMISSYYVPAPLYVWSGAGTDLNQQMSIQVQADFGFQVVDTPPQGDFCIFALLTPNTTVAEIAEVGQLLTSHPHQTFVGELHELYEVHLYLVEG